MGEKGPDGRQGRSARVRGGGSNGSDAIKSDIIQLCFVSGTCKTV